MGALQRPHYTMQPNTTTPPHKVLHQVRWRKNTFQVQTATVVKRFAPRVTTTRAPRVPGVVWKSTHCDVDDPPSAVERLEEGDVLPDVVPTAQPSWTMQSPTFVANNHN